MGHLGGCLVLLIFQLFKLLLGLLGAFFLLLEFFTDRIFLPELFSFDLSLVLRLFSEFLLSECFLQLCLDFSLLLHLKLSLMTRLFLL